jgi:hypothetical protein
VPCFYLNRPTELPRNEGAARKGAVSSGAVRDRIAKVTRAAAFDADGTRARESFLRVLIVRGVWDYSDGLPKPAVAEDAAATAAACTRAFLIEHWQAEESESELEADSDMPIAPGDGKGRCWDRCVRRP